MLYRRNPDIKMPYNGVAYLPSLMGIKLYWYKHLHTYITMLALLRGGGGMWRKGLYINQHPLLCVESILAITSVLQSFQIKFNPLLITWQIIQAGTCHMNTGIVIPDQTTSLSSLVSFLHLWSTRHCIVKCKTSIVDSYEPICPSEKFLTNSTS